MDRQLNDPNLNPNGNPGLTPEEQAMGIGSGPQMKPDSGEPRFPLRVEGDFPEAYLEKMLTISTWERIALWFVRSKAIQDPGSQHGTIVIYKQFCGKTYVVRFVETRGSGTWDGQPK